MSRVKTYSNFSDEKIFTNTSVNILCNQVFHFITEEFLNSVDTDFALTGTLAKILNGDVAASTPVKVIPFITSNTTIYDYCAKSLPKLLNGTAIKFKDRIQLKVNDFLLEVWITDLLVITESHTINCQTTADIPANIN